MEDSKEKLNEPIFLRLFNFPKAVQHENKHTLGDEGKCTNIYIYIYEGKTIAII